MSGKFTAGLPFKVGLVDQNGNLADPSHPIEMRVGPAAALVYGQRTIAAPGTEEVLAASTTLQAGVRIKALHGNTGWVYVGANPVTSTTGFVLDAGEEVFIEIDNLAKIFLDVSAGGEGVSYIGS